MPHRRQSPPPTILVEGVHEHAGLDALWSAGRLARDLDAHIEIIVPEIVPYPLPLDEPPVLRSFWNHRYRTIVEQAGIDGIEPCLSLWRSAAAPGSIRRFCKPMIINGLVALTGVEPVFAGLSCFL